MLSQIEGGTAPQLHIYTDGSSSEGLEIGGYAVAFILIVDGTSSLFGVLSGQTHGSPTCGWDLDGASPALRNEEIAIGAALLWILQSTSFCGFKDITLYYDCMSAGRAAEGAWRPPTPFFAQG